MNKAEAIRAPATACPVDPLRSVFTHSALMADLFGMELHGRLLSRVSSKRHYQGLEVAARDLLRSNVLLGKVAKRLQLFDTSRWLARIRCMRLAPASTTTPSHNPVNTTTCRTSRKIVEFPEMDLADSLLVISNASSCGRPWSYRIRGARTHCHLCNTSSCD